MDNWKERCESAGDEVARLLKVRGAGCQCGDTDACRFLRERDEAQAEVARLRQERNNWQPIETAPEDKLVLVCKEGFGWALAHKLLGAGKPWTMYVAGQPVLLQPLLQWHPTHWMPLPAPPDAGD